MVIKADPKDVAIRKQIKAIQVGFYTDDEVRQRSVVEITSPMAFDPLQNALPAGLYDPLLGPLKPEGGSIPVPCPTCALPYWHCPGHFGHVELVAPVFHPLLLDRIVLLLRCKCLYCHRLRGPTRPLQILQAKWYLLEQLQQYETLASLDEVLTAAMARARQDQADQETTSMDEAAQRASSNRAAAQAMDTILAPYLPRTPRSTDPTTTHPLRAVTSYHKQWVRALWTETVQLCKRTVRCPHCGAFRRSIRLDSSNKIFVKDLSKTMRQQQESAGLSSTLPSAWQPAKKKKKNEGETSSAPDDMDEEDEEMADDWDERSENTRLHPPTSTALEEDEDDNLMDEEAVEGEEEDDDDDDDLDDLNNTPDESKAKEGRDKLMHAGEVKAQLQRTWQKDTFLCNLVFGANKLISTAGSARNYWDRDGFSAMFLQAVPVPPSRFRPPMHLNGMAVEHAQTQYLSKIIQLNAQLRDQLASSNEARAYTSWIALQTAVNCFMDSSKDPSAAAAAGMVAPGIRQLLERKEGLFRKNMMGKRVDFAARSVISPDPYVGAHEIGLPLYFCQVLTYPTPVTDRNVKEMRTLVERGPHQYPGAVWVEIAPGRRFDLGRMKPHKRQAVAAQLLNHLKKPGGRPAIVGRQMRDGDYVLMNRQPTLHKPGIMAHQVRVLHNRSQKTIRMHYANCNTYNADFDGDEMNCHFPQSDLARAEAKYIVRTDLQYIVPTDGSPLRGLIQDHVVGGVKLTGKDTFLERCEYQQLIFAALSSLSGLEMIAHDCNILTLPPAIVKPRELWTGKQVFTTLLLHLRKSRTSSTIPDLPGLCAERKAKTPDWAFGANQEEHLLLVRDGELLRGVLDKAAFGDTPFSLVHAVYEAYGPEKAGFFLNSLGKLFTTYIQFYAGHSCRMEDLILGKEADEDRRKLIQRSYNIGARAAVAWAESEGGKVPIEPLDANALADQALKPVEVASACAKIGQLLSGVEGSANFAALDGYMQGHLNPLASDIVKTCLPDGLAVKFPYNTFSLMTATGAKGSIVNQSQVTCALGQQALEGRRVPRMSSGRTLPSFAPFDPNPRADGFVMDRFLSGIRPQEYYFHCMAGREGLIDTAVKTSRSGYLQRCLVKHLEELRISYDYTVRNAEGDVIQFLYGEDGLDPTKASYLDCTDDSLEFMARNHNALRTLNPGLRSCSIEIAAVDAARRERIELGLQGALKAGDHVVARRLRRGDKWSTGSLLKGWHHAIVTKVYSAGLVDLKYATDGAEVKRVPIEVDLGGHHDGILTSVATIVKEASPDPILCSPSRGHFVGSSGACVSERVARSAVIALTTQERVQRAIEDVGLSKEQYSALVASKYSCSLCAPGEAVGSIAAQSIGEPSTQMTLNTFHLAGAGANVTLGIPRLREIIMTASKALKTPTMSVPLLDFMTPRQAIRLSRDFTKVSLMDLISGDRGVVVTERLEQEKTGDGSWFRVYYMVLRFYSQERMKEAFGITLHDVSRIIASNYIPLLSQLMKQELRRAAVDGDVGDITVHGADTAKFIDDLDDGDTEGETRRNPQHAGDELNDEDDRQDDDVDIPGEEDGADAIRLGRRKESISYDSDSEEDVDSVKDDEAVTGEDAFDSPIAQTTNLIHDVTTPAVREESNSIVLPPLRVDPSTRPLLMVGLAEKAAAATRVRSKKNIQQAFINEEKGRGRCLQTSGVNFEEIWKLENVDHARLLSNDVWAIRCSFGVEAARSGIVDQIKGVFGAYGIEVDHRHLSLIADYMTFSGGFKPMNRIGMEDSSSMLLQMSFETTVHFLREAALRGHVDELDSPSSNLVVGRPVRHGTGSFDLLLKGT